MKKKRQTILWLLCSLLIIIALAMFYTSQISQQTDQDPTQDTTTPPVDQPTKLPVYLTAAELAELPPDIRNILTRGKLIVAMYAQDRPPFFFKDSSGNLAGSDVDLARDVALHLGVPVEFDRTAQTFDEVIQRIVQGKADIAVSKLSITLARAKKVSYSQPYIVLKQALLINRVMLASSKQNGNDIMAQINHTQGKIGVISGTSYVDYAQETFPDAQIMIYSDQASMMKAVLDGDILAVFYDENEIKKFIYEDPKRSIQLQISILSSREDRLAMAVSFENRNLQAWINHYLALNHVNQNIDTILQKYSGYGGTK